MNNKERIKSFCSVSLLAAAPVLYGVVMTESALTRIDVTAAVREAGDLRTVTANVTTRSETYALEKAFDGKTAAQTDGLFSDYFIGGNDGPVKNAYAAGGVTLEYAINAEFEPGKDIVIDGYSILSVGAHAFNRMPGTWQFQAFDETSGSWVTLDERTAYAGWKEVKGTADTPDRADGRFRFVNSKSYRKYRFLITAPYWKTAGVWTEEEAAKDNKGALQISEIQLFGYVADNIDGKVNTGLLDLTAFARESGDEFRKVTSNLKAISDDYKLENLFDGTGTNRFLSSYAASVKPAYENGGAWVEYAFDESLAPSADIIVTGYSIFCSTSSRFSHVLRRMPCDWAFQGYDEAAKDWKTLDAYHDFTCWETIDGGGATGLGFRFNFTNSVSFRKYRLLVTRAFCIRNGDDPAESNFGAIQLSEVRLFGYQGKDIAGTVGTEAAEHALKLTQWATTKNTDGQYYFDPPFAPVVSNSACTVKLGSMADLIDGLRHTRFLSTPTAMPFDLYYEMPTNMFLADKDMVLTNYVLGVDKSFADFATRVPKVWRLEAYADGRWVALDRRSEATWQEEPFTFNDKEERVLYTAAFEIAPEKRFPATRYRLRIKSLAGAPDFQLCELTFNGVWGTGVANPPPAREGLLMVVR